jgi:hypothetical protein
VCGGERVLVGRGGRWMKEIRWIHHMDDRLHIPIWNRTKKSFAIALGGRGGWVGQTMGKM